MTSTIKREFIHKRITGTIELAANAVVEKSMSELGYAPPTGYTMINGTVSMQGAGVTKVIPHFSGTRMGYVSFANSNSYNVTPQYDIDCLYQRV